MEARILSAIVFFLAFLGFMMTIVPDQYRFMTPFDFVWFGGGIIGVAGACVVWTGLPCAGALAIFGVISLLSYLATPYEWIKLLFFLPLTIIIVYLVSRLARG